MAANGVAWQEGYETTPGGRLYWRAWSPARPRAALLLVHGLAEHSGRYAHVARRFAACGYATWASTTAGMAAAPARASIRSFDAWCDDVAAGLALARRMHPGLPVVPIGHSQGGLLVLLQALRDPDERPCTVVSSPLLGVAPPSRPGALRLASRVLLRVAPRLLVPNNVNADWLSHDPPWAARTTTTRSSVTRSRPVGTARCSAQCRRPHAQAGRWASPCSSCPLTATTSWTRRPSRWVARTPTGTVDAVYWDDLHHELFNETRNEEVFAVVEKWLDGRVPPAVQP